MIKNKSDALKIHDINHGDLLFVIKANEVSVSIALNGKEVFSLEYPFLLQDLLVKVRLYAAGYKHGVESTYDDFFLAANSGKGGEDE